MQRLRVAFDAVPIARWGPLFHVLLLEQPNLSVDWQPVGFPTVDRSLLDGADVGLFVQPPAEPGLDSLVIETSQVAVVMAAGHRLGRHSELSIADVLDEAFPGSENTHPEWRSFWTLNEYRGGSPNLTDDDVRTAEQGLGVVASGRAIATAPAALVNGFPHPGIVAVPLTDGPRAATCLVWRTGDTMPAVQGLIELARAMTRPAD